MCCKIVVWTVLLFTGFPLFAQTDGYWKFLARKEWKYAAQPGRTDARWAQNITPKSIEYTYEVFDTNNTKKWLSDSITFRWDMFDPQNMMLSILPTTGNETLTPGQKVRITVTLGLIGQIYSSADAKVNVGELPLQTPYGWKSATELYPTWGYRTDPVVAVSAGRNASSAASGDFVVPKGVAGGTPLTIRASTGSQGQAAVEYVYEWVAPPAPAITAVTHNTTGGPTITPGTWFTVWGNGFAAQSRPWAPGDFNGRQLPSSLDGVQVLVRGRAALVCFISPGQINALAPLAILPERRTSR